MESQPLPSASLPRVIASGTAVCVLLILIGAPRHGGATSLKDQTPTPEKPAEEVYKNIQVFKGLPNSHLLSAMFFMAGSLQVTCDHCHNEEDFSRDDKLAKRTARKMILMDRQLNESQFQGRQMVSCNTCHRGQSPPLASLNFAEIVEPHRNGPGSQSLEPELPTAEELFERHLQAVGGKAALEKIHSRIMKGTRFSSEGWTSPIEIDEQAPDKWMDSFTVQTSFRNVFDGLHGWNQDDQGVHDQTGGDLSSLKQDADFYRDLMMGKMFPNARTIGKRNVNGRVCYLVQAESAEGDTRELYFDIETSLLVRIVRFDGSPFGPLPNAVDYADYRQLNGIQVPYTVSHLRPDFSLRDKFSDIKQNVSIAPNAFDKPANPTHKR